MASASVFAHDIFLSFPSSKALLKPRRTLIRMRVNVQGRGHWFLRSRLYVFLARYVNLALQVGFKSKPNFSTHGSRIKIKSGFPFSSQIHISTRICQIVSKSGERVWRNVRKQNYWARFLWNVQCGICLTRRSDVIQLAS